jgi:ribosome-binding factor A
MTTSRGSSGSSGSGGEEHRRSERVAARIRETLAEALLRDLSDPRLRGVVLAGVRVTDDLSLATVELVVLEDDAERKKAEQACKVLRGLEGGLRKRLAPRLSMRRVPSLRFEVDRGREEASRLDRLLYEVSQESKGSKT